MRLSNDIQFKRVGFEWPVSEFTFHIDCDDDFLESEVNAADVYLESASAIPVNDVVNAEKNFEQSSEQADVVIQNRADKPSICYFNVNVSARSASSDSCR